MFTAGDESDCSDNGTEEANITVKSAPLPKPPEFANDQRDFVVQRKNMSMYFLSIYVLLK